MTSYLLDLENKDDRSSLRGIGRYISLLHESLPDLRSRHIAQIRSGDRVIHPFFNPIGRSEHRFCLRSHIKKIAVIHDLIPMKYPASFPLGIRGKVRSVINTYLAHQIDHIVTDSEVSKRDIIQIMRIPSSRITVIYPYATGALQKTTPRDSQLPSGLKPYSYLIYVGDGNSNKNLVHMAKAIMQTSLTLVCVGSVFQNRGHDLAHPWQHELRDFLSIAQDHPQFIFTGYVSDESLSDLYANAWYNILPSYDEGFGFSYLEASKLHTPSILSDVPIFHEIATGKGCVYADPTDSEKMARTIRALTQDTHMRQVKGEEAYARQEFFSQQKFAQMWQRILK